MTPTPNDMPAGAGLANSRWLVFKPQYGPEVPRLYLGRYCVASVCMSISSNKGYYANLLLPTKNGQPNAHLCKTKEAAKEWCEAAVLYWLEQIQAPPPESA